MVIKISFFLLFANFLHFSSEILLNPSENSLSLSEFPIFTLSPSNSAANLTQIQISPLKNDKFVVSWLNQRSFPLKNEIITQVYDADTGKNEYLPIILNSSVYGSPMVTKEIFFRSGGIMMFWAEKILGKWHILVKSDYFTSNFSSNATPKQLTLVDEEAFADSFGRHSFKVEFIETDYDGFFLVAFLEKYKNKIKIKGKLVNINYNLIISEISITGDDDFKEISYITMRALAKNGFIIAFLVSEDGVDKICSRIIEFGKYSIASWLDLQDITLGYARDEVELLGIYSLNLTNVGFAEKEFESYHLIIWKSSLEIYGQILYYNGSKIGDVFLLKTWSFFNLMQICPFENDTIILFFEEDLSSSTSYLVFRFFLNGTSISWEKVTEGSFTHTSGLILQKAFPLRHRKLILLYFSDGNTVFGRYFNYRYKLNCLNYSEETMQCYQCEEGYILSSDHFQCFSRINNCSVLNYANGLCEECELPFKKSRTGQKCVQNLQFCKEFNDNGTCVSCLDSYNVTVSKMFCVPTINNCQIYSDFGECEVCVNNLIPLSSDRDLQCLSIFSLIVFTNKSNEDSKFQPIFNLAYVYQTRLLVSWLNKFDQKSYIFAQMTLLEVLHDRFLFLGSNTPQTTIFGAQSQSYFMQRIQEEMVDPIQILTSDRDGRSIFASWACYKSSTFSLHLARIFFDQSPTETYLVTNTPMLLEDFQYNGGSPIMKRLSNGVVLMFWTVRDSIESLFSVYGAVVDPARPEGPIPIALNLSEKVTKNYGEPFFKVEVLDCDAIVICYLENNDLGDYILISTYWMNEWYELSKLGSNRIGIFQPNNIKNIEVLKKGDDFIVFWQNDTISFQRFNIFCAKSMGIHVFNTSNAPYASYFSKMSVCNLADDRWLVVWGYDNKYRTAETTFFKIEGDDRVHAIYKNPGLDPSVTCREALSPLDGTSSFIIAWSNTTTIDPNTSYTNYLMNIFVAKRMTFCQEYDESLQKCTLCQKNSITTLSSSNLVLCWRKVPGCNDTYHNYYNNYDNNTGACDVCLNNGLLVDSNGFDASENRSIGDYCVAKVGNCKQYDVLTPGYPCLNCEETYNLTDGVCVLPIPNCQTQNGYICSHCKENFTLQDNLCYKNIPHCSRFSTTNSDTCEYCENHFNLTENKSNCAQWIENCDTYSSETLLCSHCTEDYIQDSNHECKSKMSTLIISLITLSSLLVLIMVSFTLVHCYRKRRNSNDDDFKMYNVALEEETIQKKTLIMLEEGKAPTLREFINDLENCNNITRFNLIEEQEPFTDMRQIKRTTQKLGSGGTALVWLARDLNGKEFALKVFVEKSKDFYYNPSESNNFRNMITEYKKICTQERVVRMEGIAYSEANGLFTLGIVLEKMDNDLLKLLETKKDLSFEKKLDISIKITEALIFFHELYVHHDLKPKNILTREKENEYEVKISDFGTCLKKNPYAGESPNNLILKNLTIQYASPENLLHIRTGFPLTNLPSSDIWSLGLVLYKIFVGIEEEKKIKFPWRDYMKKKQDNNKLTEIIVEEGKKKNEYFDNSVVRANVPKNIGELINDCLQVDYGKRIDLNQVWKKLREMRENSRRETNSDMSQMNLEENLL